MQVRDKQTKELVELSITIETKNLKKHEVETDYGEEITLASLNERFEDVVEEKPPVSYWYISADSGGVVEKIDTGSKTDLFNEEVGNRFETREAAEKKMEQLKKNTSKK